jgi:CheY-like chemotaxis protein
MSDAPATLLVVDDNEAKRYILTTWLRRAGHTVIEAASGGEALEKVGAVELVLLDVNMPDMSGYEVCRRIKSDPRTAAIPVIQVSATAVTVSDRAAGLTQGADAYLTEPTEPTELLAVVVAALRYSRARQRAERTASLLATLTSSTLRINAAETFDGLAAASAVGAARIFAVLSVVILEMPDGQVRRVAAIPGHQGTVRRGGPPGLAARVAEYVLAPGQGSALATVSREDWLRLVPDSTLPVDVCVAAARIKPGKPAAAIVVDCAGISGEEDLQILSQLTQSVALGLEALRSFAEEHLVALTLQRSFLPATLPAIPGVTMAFRYLPASDTAEVGGDFYEALPWRDGVLLAIGDVQGHSLAAANVMGELRHALRAFVSEGHPPLTIVGLVNEVLRRYHPGIIATLCLVLVDLSTGELAIVNCGHMPLLLLDGTGAAFVGEGGIMLGLTRHEPHQETASLSAGGTVLLFTDGLVEDRSVLLDANLEKLRAAALEAAAGDVEAFANHVMSVFGVREDDVAMLALRRAHEALCVLSLVQRRGQARVHRQDSTGADQLEDAEHRAVRRDGYPELDAARNGRLMGEHDRVDPRGVAEGRRRHVRDRDFHAGCQGRDELIVDLLGIGDVDLGWQQHDNWLDLRRLITHYSATPAAANARPAGARLPRSGRLACGFLSGMGTRRATWHGARVHAGWAIG